MRKTVVVDLTTSTGIRELETLKNDRRVHIIEQHEYCAVPGSEDGPVPFLMRSIDFEVRDTNPLTEDTLHPMPMC